MMNIEQAFTNFFNTASGTQNQKRQLDLEKLKTKQGIANSAAVKLIDTFIGNDDSRKVLDNDTEITGFIDIWKTYDNDESNIANEDPSNTNLSEETRAESILTKTIMTAPSGVSGDWSVNSSTLGDAVSVRPATPNTISPPIISSDASVSNNNDGLTVTLNGVQLTSGTNVDSGSMTGKSLYIKLNDSNLLELQTGQYSVGANGQITFNLPNDKVAQLLGITAGTTTPTNITKVQLAIADPGKTEQNLTGAFVSKDLPQAYQVQVAPNTQTQTQTQNTQTFPTSQPVTALGTITDTNIQKTILPGDANAQNTLATNLANYFNAQRDNLAKLGAGQGTVDFTAAADNTTRGLNIIYQAAKAQAGSNDVNTIKPEDLLKTAYREQVLIGLRLMLGEQKFQEQADKIAAALTKNDAGGNINGTQYLRDFLTTNTSVQITPQSTDYLSGQNGGPGAIGRVLDNTSRTALYNQVNNITSGDAQKVATGWLSLYGKSGLGGRSFGVIKDGNVVYDKQNNSYGNASVYKNLPAFASRYFFKEISSPIANFAEAKTRLNSLLGIDLNSSTFTAIPGLSQALEGKFNELNQNGELNNFMAGLLATSVKSVAPGASGKQIKVTLDMQNLLTRFFAHIGTGIPAFNDAAKAAINAAIANTPTKEIPMNLTENISWDKSTDINNSPAYKILNELFNTKNNPNSPNTNTESTIINQINQAASTNASNTQNNSTTPVVNTAEIDRLIPANYRAPNGAALTKADAQTIMSNWLRAKRDVFASSFNGALADKFTTGGYRQGLGQGQSTFANQQILSIGAPSKIDDNNYIVDFTISESVDNRAATPTNYKFTFTKTQEGWKISARQ